MSARQGHAAAGRAVILAAGLGSRLALGPKAHVWLGGETFLARAAGACLRAGLSGVTVVGRPDDVRLLPACRALGVAAVLNASADEGMWSSVRAGLRAAAEWGAGPVVLLPVDFPLVQPSTIGSLASAASRAGGSSWARPIFDGRRGHPIALGSALGARLLTLEGAASLRDALASAAAHPLDVHCADPGVLANINTPDDLDRARRAIGRSGATRRLRLARWVRER